MNTMNKAVAGLTVALTLGASAVAYAHPGAMGGQMGAGTQAGPQAGMQHGPQAAQQLMTPEERTATMEKMRAAKTPEERLQIAAATRAEMQKRSTERGITLPEPRGHRHGASTTPATPDTTGHAH